MTPEPSACALTLHLAVTPQGPNAASHALYCSEEGKLSTSQDAACKDVEESPEPAEAKAAAPRPPGSGAERR